MKRLIRTTLGIAAAGTAVLVLGWVATFFYWHVRITQAMRIWEDEGSVCKGFRVYWRRDDAPPEADRILQSAGCRALPYFVRALDGSGTTYFKNNVVSRTIQFLAGPVPRRDPDVMRRLNQRYETWHLNDAGSIALREERVGCARRWWREHADHRHQWWRIWSPSCPRIDCSVCER